MEGSAAFLVEASWEVCNKVGGIHTVVTSKLPSVLAQFGSHYLAVGPALAEQNPALQPHPIPDWLQPVVAPLQAKGVGVRYGTWVGEGNNVGTVLLDWSALIPQRDELKRQFWNSHQLDTLHSDFYDLDQPLLWSVAVGHFAAELQKTLKQPVLLQLHEWLSAGALLVLPESDQLRTVFTTHATVLGRALASEGHMVTPKSKIDPDAEAARLRVTSKHQLERIGATKSTVFTTVSQLTADEAAVVLGKAPDEVTENALASQLLTPLDELIQLRSVVREELNTVLAATHFPTHYFDLEQTFHIFTMGRSETHAKGYDRLLESLGQINQQLKDEHANRTLAAWILVPGAATRVRPASAGQLLIYQRIEQILNSSADHAAPNWYASFMVDDADSLPEFLLDDDFQAHHQHQITSLLRKLVRPTQAFISPFEVADESQDPIFQLAAKYGLSNKPEDRVKLLYFPVYLEGLDGVLNRPLTQILPAFDLGVFPSFYEPWGYTPMECVAAGIPAITTTYTGYGIAAQKAKGPESVQVLERDSSEETFTTLLTKSIRKAMDEPTPEVARLAALQLRRSFTWDERYKAYVRAYKLAEK